MIVAASAGSRPSTGSLAVLLGVICLGLGIAFGYAVRHPDSSIGKWTRWENNWNGALPGPRTIRLGSTKGFRVVSAVLLLAGVALVIAGLVSLA